MPYPRPASLGFTNGGAERVVCSALSAIDDLAQGTWMVLFKPTATPLSQRTLLSKGTVGTTGHKYIQYRTTGYLRFLIDYSTTDLTYTMTSQALTVGEWHWCFVTFDPSAGTAAKAQFYIGKVDRPVLLATKSATEPVGTVTGDSGTGLYIGNTTANNNAPIGNIALAAVWDRILTTEEMEWQRTHPATPVSPGACKIYMPLGNSSRLAAYDAEHNVVGAVTSASFQEAPPLNWTYSTPIDFATSIAAGGAITGSLTATLDAATLSATGTLPIVGTLAKTLDAATITGTGTLPIVGQSTPTLDAATLSATGTLPISGQATPTLDDATLSATGTLAIAGQAGVTLADATLGATGALAIVGQAGITLADATLVATGSGTLAPITGALGVTLADATLAGTGALAIAGQASVTLADATLVALGASPQAATFAAYAGPGTFYAQAVGSLVASKVAVFTADAKGYNILAGAGVSPFRAGALPALAAQAAPQLEA